MLGGIGLSSEVAGRLAGRRGHKQGLLIVRDSEIDQVF